MDLMVSGVQPTGMLTLGNYIGAIQNFVKLQEDYNLIIFVADLHALTNKIDPQTLRKYTRDTAALFLACGINPKKTILFKQSDLQEHANLSYILSCNSYMGELSRMTQYKDKKSKFKNDAIPTGLFIYPTLMASDILLYDAKYVPIGEDQKQHLELTRDLAIRFNNRYGETFVVPEAIIPKYGAKIKSLKDPLKKMSKSSEVDDSGSIRLLDDLNVVKKKIMSAVTDSENIVKYDVKNKPGISNLMTIYSVLTDKSLKEIEKEFYDKGYGNFKKAVSEVVVNKIEDIQKKYNNIIENGELEKILEDGANKAKIIAQKKILDVKKKIGLI